jgi:molybdopterin-guanine dinucleotide biosynthesis protein A
MAKDSRLFGLVLAGGHSTRMGEDKGLISYHGMPQRLYLLEELKPFCDEVFLSIRKDQEGELDDTIPRIVDEDKYRGPFNGLLSAHHAYPEAAFFVIACDLPMVNSTVLKYLYDHRNTGSVATAFATWESGLPEPLAAIWEPAGLRSAEIYLETAKSSCPRKFLIHSQTTLVTPKDDLWVANANAPSDYKAIRDKIHGR